MSEHSRRSAVAILLPSLMLAACGELGSQTTPDREADRAAIIELQYANARASSAGNAEGVAATFVKDGDVWIAGLSRELVANQKHIGELEEDFNAIPGFQSWEANIDSIRFISRDAAIAEVTGLTKLDDSEHEEKATVVFARTDAGWRIAAVRVMKFDQELLDKMGG